MDFIQGLSKREWPFSPQSLPNCLLWLDAADSSSYTLTTGNITQWKNKGFAGGTTTTVSGTITPSSNMFVFGTNAYITAPSLAFTQTDRTVFIVSNVAGGYTIQLLSSVGVNMIDVQFQTTGTNLQLRVNDNNIYVASSPSPFFNTLNICCAATNNGIYLTGASQTVSSSANSFISGTTTSQRIGGTIGGSCRIGEVLIFDGVLTTVQQQQVEGYLANKWVLASSLPALHPYNKTANRYLPVIPYNLPFKPTDIYGCQLWLDAADPATVVLSESIVSIWSDKSINKNDMSSLAGTISYTAGTAVTFASGGVMQTAKSIPVTTNSFVFVVCQNTSYSRTSPLFPPENIIPTNYVVACPDINSQIRFAAIESGLSMSGYGQLIVGSLYSATSADIGYFPGAYYVNGVTGLPLGGGLIGLPEGTNIIGGRFGSAGSTRFSLSSFASFFIGTIQEVIVYESLTTSQRLQVEAYLAKKWNLVGLLPPPHPGKSLPAISTSFIPKSINTLQLWLDAADPISVNSTITGITWYDKSGSSNNMSYYIYSSGSVTYNRNIAKPYLEFQGGVLQTTTSINVGLSTGVFVVCQNTAMTSVGAPTNYVVACPDITREIRFYSTTSNPDSASLYSGSSADIGYTPGAYYVNGTYGIPTDNRISILPGINLIYGQFNTTGSTRFSLSSSESSNTFIGNIYEVLLFSSLTTYQQRQVEQYLTQKWGIAYTPTLP